MNKFLIFFLLILLASFISCNRKDNVRTVVPTVSWSYDGINYTATSIQLDYQGYYDGYYEIIARYEDAAEQNTLIIGLTNGIAAGNHTVGAYYVNYITYDKLSQFGNTIGFQVYTIDVTGYNGVFVNGTFSANNASGPVLSGTFADIHSEP